MPALRGKCKAVSCWMRKSVIKWSICERRGEWVLVYFKFCSVSKPIWRRYEVTSSIPPWFWLLFTMVKSRPQRAWGNHIYRAGSWVTYRDDNCEWVVCRWEGGGWVSIQSMGEMGKDFCPNFLQPFLENIDRRSCNDGSRELIPVFHNPHRKRRPSPSAVALILEYFEGLPS